MLWSQVDTMKFGSHVSRTFSSRPECSLVPRKVSFLSTTSNWSSSSCHKFRTENIGYTKLHQLLQRLRTLHRCPLPQPSQSPYHFQVNQSASRLFSNVLPMYEIQFNSHLKKIKGGFIMIWDLIFLWIWSDVTTLPGQTHQVVYHGYPTMQRSNRSTK